MAASVITVPALVTAQALRAALVVSLLLTMSCARADLSSPKIDAASIRRVALGMTEREVEAILGSPFSVEPDNGDPSERVMAFSRATGGYWYPMLWVHLRDGRVRSVYAKRYQGWDDFGVYALSADVRWEHERFEETFPLRAK